MVENMLKGTYDGTRLVHVRMAFSRRLDEIGGVSVRKVVHVFGLTLRIAHARYRFRASALYYPPAGPDWIPMSRDMAVLLITRRLFRSTILHFHAGGVSELYRRMPSALRVLFRAAYFDADAGIKTSALAPDDPTALRARRAFVVPNGIEDAAGLAGVNEPRNRGSGPPTILFVGLLRESKGVLILLEACAELRRRGRQFRVKLVGEFHSRQMEARVRDVIQKDGLNGIVRHDGVLTGSEKHLAYAKASIFCFPSFFESETFGLVLLEAMQFGLPIVATSWRGIPSVVTEGDNGYLVPIRDSRAVANRLEALLRDPDLAAEMGRRGRERYEELFTLDRFHGGMQQVFDAVRTDGLR
jgi:glycosyltransferase involved in cell wall biosynthesis